MSNTARMPKSRTGGAFKLVSIFVLQIAFVVVLHLLGGVDKMSIDFSNFSQWLDITPPEVALAASIRILALVFSYWLLATSLIYMIARAFHMTKLIRGLEFITLPGVRRAIDAGLAATIIGGTVFGGAAAVFAHSPQQAQATQSPAVASQYQDLRSLYNPSASSGYGAVVQESTSVQSSGTPVQSVYDTSTPLVVQNPDEAPLIAPSNTGDIASVQAQKVVVSPIEEAATPTQDGPVKDPSGNYVPTPAESNPVTSTTPKETDNSSPTPVETIPTSTQAPKVVVTTPGAPTPTTTPGTPDPTHSPTPVETNPTTTTTPKVTTPTTSTPVVTDPSVDVGGKQVERPADTPSTPAAQTPGTYTVVSGDNFWNIAKAHVRSQTGHEPTNAEVASYWVKLIEANRSTIRSGDPDLIYPGEVFTLPPL